jgi:hypothetical protein
MYKYSIPTEIDVNGKTFKIRNQGDYRVMLDCFAVLDDPDLDKNERLLGCLIIFYDNFSDIADIEHLTSEDLETAVSEMYKFFNCGSDESSNPKHNYKLIDWDKDSQLICSAINKVANTEIRAVDYLHWWTFMGYYSAIGESVLSTVVGIRDKIVSNKKLEKWENKFRNENPQYFAWNMRTAEQVADDEYVKNLWNSGK